MNGTPASAAVFLQKISELCQQGRVDDAQTLCSDLLARDAWTFDELHAMAVAFAHGRVPKAALMVLKRAVQMQPGNAAAQGNQGTVLQALGRLDAALASFDRAISLKPDYALAHSNRGSVLNQLGHVDAALASYDEAIRIAPGLAAPHHGRGNVLLRLRSWMTALASYDQALAIDAKSAAVYSNRGVALTAVGRLDEAAASFDAAIVLDCDYAEAYVGRGAVRKEQNQLQAALADYNLALTLRNSYAEAYFGRAIVLLLQGDLQRGWRDFEWRWQRGSRTSDKIEQNYVKPLWVGHESIAGKTLLIHAEKGLGDTLQFCRYVPLLSDWKVRVLFKVQVPLMGVLGTLEGDLVVTAETDASPDFDYHCPLLSLPLVFKTTLETIPATLRYLRADGSRVDRWRTRLGERRAPRIGIVWRGDPLNLDDANRSIELGLLMQYLPAGFHYFSLQKNLNDEEKQLLGSNDALWSSVQALDFDETAALCECLDLIISVDTSIAHLSAAMGRPTWILLPFSPDCRWLLDRSDSPWYPTATLFRQPLAADWTSVLRRVASRVRAHFWDRVRCAPAGE